MDRWMGKLDERHAESEVRLESLTSSVEKAVLRLDSVEARMSQRLDLLEKKMNEPNPQPVEMNKRLEALEARLSAVESKPPPAAHAGGPMSARSGSSFLTTAGTASVEDARRLHGAAGYQAENQRFVPTKLMIRGWSEYGDRESGKNGLTRTEAQAILEGLVADLPNDMQSLVQIAAPFHRNWQLTLRFQNDLPSDDCWSVFKEVKKLCEKTELRGNKLYCIMESPPWKLIAKKHMRAAGQAIRELLKKDVQYSFDWKQSQLWISAITGEPLDIMAGSEYRRDSVWNFSLECP
jgi:hypothetical protein